MTSIINIPPRTVTGICRPAPQLVTDVRGAVDYTGQSRAQLYKHMRAGLLPPTRTAPARSSSTTILTVHARLSAREV